MSNTVIKNTQVSLSTIAQFAEQPIYNASQLQGTPIDDLTGVQPGNVLMWQGPTGWGYSDEVVGQTGYTGYTGPTGYTGYTGYTGANGPAVALDGLGNLLVRNQPEDVDISGSNNIILGYDAGITSATMTTSASVLLGYSAGGFSDTGGGNRIAIGTFSGYMDQASSAIAIGNEAGSTSQAVASVAVGTNAGSNGQASNAVAIGTMAGYSNQGANALAVGLNSGKFNQGQDSLSIGSYSGQTSQATTAIAIGTHAGEQTQGVSCIAIGSYAGSVSQSNYSIAIGASAGYQEQSQYAVAIGSTAAYQDQSDYAVAIGYQTGYSAQGISSVAVGTRAGYQNQGTDAVAIGTSAGEVDQGDYAVAIGYVAGQAYQGANSIVLNATSATFDVESGKFYVDPIDTGSSSSDPLLAYDSVTREVYQNTAKTFVISHPLDSSKYLVHACLEGPEAGVYYRGRGVIEQRSLHSTIVLPHYVPHIANDFTIQITAIGTHPITLAVTDVNERGQFTVSLDSAKDTPQSFFWEVMGTRQSIDTEPLRSSVHVRGDGPYTFIEEV